MVTGTVNGYDSNYVFTYFLIIQRSTFCNFGTSVTVFAF